jgi:hypothetical protein
LSGKPATYSDQELRVIRGQKVPNRTGQMYSHRPTLEIKGLLHPEGCALPGHTSPAFGWPGLHAASCRRNLFANAVSTPDVYTQLSRRILYFHTFRVLNDHTCCISVHYALLRPWENEDNSKKGFKSSNGAQHGARTITH